MTQCVDCAAEGIVTFRPIASGKRKPRCATHAKAFMKASKARAHGRTVEKTYGITAEQYWQLYAAQGGKCYICQRATGVTKRLAVDHDHATGEVRGLLCGPDNQLIGRLGVDALRRAADYLENPPARELFNG